MGAINCCIDVSAVDVDACSSVVACSGVASHEESRVKESIRDGDDARTCSSSGSSSPDLDEKTVPNSASSEVSSESTQTPRRARRKRKANQKKLTERQPSYSLFQVTSKTVLRLSDYLCPCDPCPHSQRIDRLLESPLTSSHISGKDTTTHDSAAMRASIHRVLRGCATFDERRDLDESVVLLVKELLVQAHGDEDQAFRQLITHKYQPPAAARRGSAVTA